MEITRSPLSLSVASEPASPEICDAPTSAEVESLFFELGKFLTQQPRNRQPTNDSGQHEAPDTAADETLPTMEDRYRVLVEQIPAVVFMALLDGGIGEAYVSPQIEQVLGFSREEWLDDPIRWYQQIHPDDRVRWSFEAAGIFTGKTLKSIYRVIARDGRVLWFHCEVKLVRRKDGQPWFIHGVGFDITDLKRTEQALQEEIAAREQRQKLELERQIAKAEQMESRLAAIVESSEDAIIGKNLDGTITSWNAAATRLFGYEPAEILGKSVLLLIPPERHGEEMEILSKLRAGERIEHKEIQRLAKSGARLDVSLTISPVRDRDGRVIGASKIIRDITERKRSEEKLRLTEKLAATGRLAAAIAHEVNNPLEAITNLLHLVRHESGLSDAARHYLEMADQELNRVAHVTKQTLGFYRDSTLPSRFKVSDVIEDVLAIYAGHIASRNLKIDKQLDPGAEVLAFSGEFRQVISNLLVNAIDAMAGRGGRLIVRVRSHRHWAEPVSEGVRISIADTGMGIPPEHRNKIFEAFYTTKESTGTGLGLWLSRTLVQKHGGSIRMRSRTGPEPRGTVFSIFWPLSPPAKAPRLP